MPNETSAPAKATARRCFFRALAFTAGLVALFGALYAVGYSPYEAPQVRSDRRNLARLATRNAAVFGSSHGFNVLPDKAGLDGVNLAHGGQDVFEMAYMARAVERAAPHLKTAIFAISYFTFDFDNAAYVLSGTQTRIGRRLVMYAAFPGFEVIPGDASSYVKGVLSPIVTRDHWKSLLWPGGSPRDRFPEASDLPPSPKRDRHVASERMIHAHAKFRCRQYSELMKNMTSNHPRLPADAFEALRDVSLELERKRVRVVLVLPPYFEAYNECFDPKRQARSREFAQRIAEDTGAEFFDASTEAEFASQRELFQNSDHLNRDGKIEFSRWLGRRLARSLDP